MHDYTGFTLASRARLSAPVRPQNGFCIPMSPHHSPAQRRSTTASHKPGTGYSGRTSPPQRHSTISRRVVLELTARAGAALRALERRARVALVRLQSHVALPLEWHQR